MLGGELSPPSNLKENPMGIGSSGVVVKTADGNLSTAGKPVRVFSLTVVSGSTAGANLYNGTAISGTPRVALVGVANASNTVNFEGGLLFPDGCYVDLVGASQAVIECRLEL